MLFINPAFALILDSRKDGGAQQSINEIGHKILNANEIPYKVTFEVSKKEDINACTHYRNNSIVIYRGLLLYAASLEEVAAVMAHEISHAVDYRQGALKGYFSYLMAGLSPKKYEYKADKRAVDYLVKAGYNPVASIVILNKIAPQHRYDWYASHPLTTRRMSTIYEYIYTKYPQYLVDNKYKDDVYYQNFLLVTKENRKKFEQKVKSNSTRSVNYL